MRRLFLIFLLACLPLESWAAAITHGVTLSSNSNASSYTTASFTPTNGDLLVLLASIWDTTTDPGTVSDSLGGSWTRVFDYDTDYQSVWIRSAFSDGSALTVTVDVTGDPATGAILFVARASGMSRTGAAAFRQGNNNTGGGGTAPNTTFAAAALTGNPTIAKMHNITNPAGLTPPTNWTEQVDTGHNQPTAGAEYATRDSGFTGTTITWGSSSASGWRAVSIELDSSAPSAGRRVIVVN